jgi:hypothetical protein
MNFYFHLGILQKKTSDVYEREIEYLKAQLMRSESRSSIINLKNRAFEESLSKWRFSNKLLNEYKNKTLNFILFFIIKKKHLDPKKVDHFLIVLNKN